VGFLVDSDRFPSAFWFSPANCHFASCPIFIYHLATDAM
jgi:hypothetical protein